MSEANDKKVCISLQFNCLARNRRAHATNMCHLAVSYSPQLQTSHKRVKAQAKCVRHVADEPAHSAASTHNRVKCGVSEPAKYRVVHTLGLNVATFLAFIFRELGLLRSSEVVEAWTQQTHVGRGRSQVGKSSRGDEHAHDNERGPGAMQTCLAGFGRGLLRVLVVRHGESLGKARSAQVRIEWRSNSRDWSEVAAEQRLQGGRGPEIEGEARYECQAKRAGGHRVGGELGADSEKNGAP